MVQLADFLAMSSPQRLATIAILAGLIFTAPAAAQTYTTCNPLQQTCQPDTALGKSISVNFKDGASDQFTAQGAPTYNSNGAQFTVAKSGDSPTLVSKWYIMFGEVSISMKAAPGTGIVSSVVLQSDDLDEIDWEWVGGASGQVQSNYFGKGQTTSYDRAAVHTVSNTQGEWHTYTTKWTENQIVWSIDGTTVRVLNAGDANGQYPQTPMQLKIGVWAGGDPSNSQGTISWAGGATNYAAGPFSMYAATVSVVDYSTGKSYTYGDKSGTWESIESNGGKVNGNSDGTATVANAPAITSTSSGNDAWDGTHKTNTATVSYTTLPGLPSGWSISGSGKVVPSSATPSTSQAISSTPSQAASPAASCSGSGYKVVTAYDQKGFLTTATIPAGASTGWNAQGLPTTVLPANCAISNTPVAAYDKLKEAEASPTSSTQMLLATADSSSLITAQVSKTAGAATIRFPGLTAFCTVFLASAMGAFFL